jgi:hypothetical protein
LTNANFHELRYEDLVRDPLGEMRRLYERLGIGDFDESRAPMEKLLKERAGYRPSSEPLSEFWRAQVAERWNTLIERYGYK